MKFWAISWYLTSYLTSQSHLSRQKVNILEFWHLHRVPRVKICIHTTFQLNLIIFWHSNNIWMKFWSISWYLTSYLTSQTRLSRQKVNILEFGHFHRVSRVKICIHTTFQLNLIIFWHSNTIWMNLRAILWYLTSYLTSQYRFTPSKSLKYHDSDITIGFASKKLTFTQSETNAVILMRFLSF